MPNGPHQTEFTVAIEAKTIDVPSIVHQHSMVRASGYRANVEHTRLALANENWRRPANCIPTTKLNQARINPNSHGSTTTHLPVCIITPGIYITGVGQHHAVKVTGYNTHNMLSNEAVDLNSE